MDPETVPYINMYTAVYIYGCSPLPRQMQWQMKVYKDPLLKMEQNPVCDITSWWIQPN